MPNKNLLCKKRLSQTKLSQVIVSFCSFVMDCMHNNSIFTGRGGFKKNEQVTVDLVQNMDGLSIHLFMQLDTSSVIVPAVSGSFESWKGIDPFPACVQAVDFGCKVTGVACYFKKPTLLNSPILYNLSASIAVF